MARCATETSKILRASVAVSATKTFLSFYSHKETTDIAKDCCLRTGSLLSVLPFASTTQYTTVRRIPRAAMYHAAPSDNQ